MVRARCACVRWLDHTQQCQQATQEDLGIHRRSDTVLGVDARGIVSLDARYKAVAGEFVEV